MLLSNAIKKLEKAGFKVEESEHTKSQQFNKTYYAVNPQYKHFIEVLSQGEDIALIDLRTPGHDDDSMTDYHAGTFCDNITQAIRYATTW